MNRNDVEQVIFRHCYSYQEAADKLNISRQMLHKLVSTGELSNLQHEGVKLIMKTDVLQRIEKLKGNTWGGKRI